MGRAKQLRIFQVGPPMQPSIRHGNPPTYPPLRTTRSRNMLAERTAKCHSSGSRNPSLFPAQGGTPDPIGLLFFWIPAFAGMTNSPSPGFASLRRPLPPGERRGCRRDVCGTTSAVRRLRYDVCGTTSAVRHLRYDVCGTTSAVRHLRYEGGPLTRPTCRFPGLFRKVERCLDSRLRGGMPHWV